MSCCGNSVAAGAKETTTGVGFAGYTTFNQVTPAVCYSIPNGTEGRLKDARDGKIYWVAKLADGLCWMTQNLDYDGGGSGSNVVSLTKGTSFSSSMTDSMLYYDPGEYINTQPTVSSACSGATTSTGLNECTTGWKTFDKTLLTSETASGSDIEELHYSIGNYYNWQGATAGTGSAVTVDGDEASGSICPAGWRLPLSGTKNDNTNGSFSRLFMSYGNNSGLSYGMQDILLAPLYFVYGGYAYSDTLYYVGSHGYYWSAMADSNGGAYSSDFDSSGVSSSFSSARYHGFSVRCIAR